MPMIVRPAAPPVGVPRWGYGVEGIGVHTLRHSAAVAWLESGTHTKAVADLLGNSSVSITGDIYGHTPDDTAWANGMRLIPLFLLASPCRASHPRVEAVLVVPRLAASVAGPDDAPTQL